MARRFTAVIGLVAALSGCDSSGNGTGAAGISGGAGPSGGGTSGIEALCASGCEKVGACHADAGIPVQDIVASCKVACQISADPPGAVVCTNESRIIAASQACLQKSCAQLESCLDDVPRCQGGVGGSGGAGAKGAGGAGGRGGSPGAGGVTGTGGSGVTGWNCSQYTTGCVCVPSASPGPSCTAIYSCCYTMMSGVGDTCTCLKALDAPTCTTTIPPTGGKIVAHCPPP